MKKFFSLILALTLVFCMFGATSVAFAAETEEGTDGEQTRVVTFVESAFLALDDVKTLDKLHAVGGFQLKYTWLTDVEKVNSVFEGANYVLATASEDEEQSDPYAVAEGSDKISVEYCSPSKDYKDENWSGATVGKDISVSTTGWWNFRYVLKDADGNVLARTSYVSIYFGDEKAPVINGLSSDMKKVQSEGIKVGGTYTIKTNLSLNDTSSTTVTYVVYKLVNGSWTADPIYDSTTKVVAEGYEDGISTAGVITMHENDVLKDNTPVYKIVYTVKDSLGYVSDTIDMTIYAKADEDNTVDSTTVWKYVLLGIAALSAVAIVVLLLVKPKQAETEQTSAQGSKSSKK